MDIPCQIERSRRKSIVLRVERDGSLLVKAPFGMTDEEIEQFIAKREAWIQKRQETEKQGQFRREQISFREGGKMPVLGFMVELRYHREDRIVLSGEEELMRQQTDRPSEYLEAQAVLYLPAPELRSKRITLAPEVISEAEEIRQNRELLRHWYQERTRECFQQRTAYYAEKMGLHYDGIRINSSKRNWGSCRSSAYISYSLADYGLGQYERDYLVVHELAHIRFMDHKKGFYSVVEKELPDRKEREAAFKELGWMLRIFDEEKKE